MFTGIIQQLGRVRALQPSEFGAVLLVDASDWLHQPSIGESIAVNGCCLTMGQDSPINGSAVATGAAATGPLKRDVSPALTQRGTAPAASSRGPHAALLRFDIIRQTLQTTTLSGLQPGDPVNLEHAVTPQTLLGGHVVQGHIDGVGVVVQAKREAAEWRLRIQPPVDTIECIAVKGSIAVDGVSLTVVQVGADWFDVALIPATRRSTTLGGLQQGSRVNIETDYFAKIIVNWLRRKATP